MKRRKDDPFVYKKCPICKKNFIAAPQHAWKIGSEKGYKLVCSYHCMRAYEKEHPPKRRKERKER